MVERQLLDAAFGIVPANEAAFIRVDAVEGNPQVVYTRQRAGITPTAPNPGVVKQVLSKRTAILISAARQGSSSGSGADAAVTSALAVPLIDQERTVGALYLATTDPHAVFDRLHLEVVTALAAIGSAALANALRFESLAAESDRLKQELCISHEMVGTSGVMERLYRVIAKIAPTDLTVLISGETGTGKELAARALHANSKRASSPFVAINCATIGGDLLESELFGHERGAFTGAVATKTRQVRNGRWRHALSRRDRGAAGGAPGQAPARAAAARVRASRRHACHQGRRARSSRRPIAT